MRRGFLRSPVDGEVGPDKLGADVEDLAALIERHGEPAVVLGSSSGAIVALELLVRRPDLVRAVVAHEPPLISLLEDRETCASSGSTRCSPRTAARASRRRWRSSAR